METRPGDNDVSFGRRVLDAFNPHIESNLKRTNVWAGFTAQFVLITTAALLYFGVRMVTKDAEAAAFANAQDLLRFEARLGLDIEAWAQEQILGSEAIVTFFNWVYIWLHWPVIIGAFFWLYRYNKRGFVLFRNAMIVSGAIGLIFFVTYPVAPPRFLDGFSDTVSDLSTSYKYLQPPSIVNKFAAMPSLHVGYPPQRHPVHPARVARPHDRLGGAHREPLRGRCGGRSGRRPRRSLRCKTVDRLDRAAGS